MSKTLSELVLEFEEASRAADEAIAARAQAKRRLDEARLAETGLAGHLVSYSAPYGFSGQRRTKRFVVDGIGWGRRVEGRSIKADGTPGERRDSAMADDVTDHGLYEGPKS